MRFVVIGCGSIGRRHTANLLALGESDILAHDPDPARLAELSRLSPDIVVSEDLEELWGRDPDVAIVATPTSMHLQHAVEAARRGCALFVEKPLADRLDGLDELLDLVDRGSLATLVGCNLRFHPGLAKVRELVREGAVGRLVSIRAEVGQYLPDWHPHEDYRQGYSARRALGGGVILDAIHEIDYVRWIVGEVDSVACFADHISGLEIDTEDVAALLLRFRDGAIGEVHLDYVQRSYSRGSRVVGEQGTILWDFGEGTTRIYRAGTGEWETYRDPEGWQANDMYVDEMRYFLARLRSGEPSESSVFDAARVLRIALAAKWAAYRGQVVHLDETPAFPEDAAMIASTGGDKP